MRSFISFSAPNNFSSTMAPGFTQPLTEINTGRFLGVKVRLACTADNPTAINEPIV
jgi:hypothetical protein